MERFWMKVNKTATCWLWTAATKGGGYGSFFFNGKHAYAHRVSYSFSKGEIPSNLQLDHLCRVRRCVNPDHLEAVTQKENLLRGTGAPARNARKTHCKHGHPLSGDNLYIYPNGDRRCCTCHRRENKTGYRNKKMREDI